MSGPVTDPARSVDLTGRRVLITGSSRGIGFGLAAGLLAAGATVVLNGRDPAALDRARAELPRLAGASVQVSAFDVTDEDAVVAAVDRIEATLGPIEVLVNNAGIQHRQPLLDVSLADWNRVLATDVTAAFLVGRAVARHQLARGHGKIVNICSVQSELARPSIGAYTAAKGALRNLTRAMTAEWAGGGLQINGVAPGYIATEMTRSLRDDPEFDSWVRGRTPAGRWGEVADLVGPVAFFASAAADFVTGQVLFVDGGMTAVV